MRNRKQVHVMSQFRDKAYHYHVRKNSTQYYLLLNIWDGASPNNQIHTSYSITYVHEIRQVIQTMRS